MTTANRALNRIQAAERRLQEQFALLDEVALSNQRRVLDAFREHRVTEEHFAERTGYGIDDVARELIDAIFADIFQTEAAAVRMQIVSGTHALACALMGNLRPGDRLVCLTGTPYDTLDKVIGHRAPTQGSLVDSGIEYVEADCTAANWHADKLPALLQPPTRMAYIQKSCGYSFERQTLSNESIAQLCAQVKQANPQCLVMVDNCYGEFVEAQEPTAIGADLVAGSLIKNPGGGLAITGGYIAGKKELVTAALRRLTAPGIDGHLGIMFNQNRLLLQGLFLAPAVVANAVKGALLVAQVFADLGYEVKPAPTQARADIIQAIKFGNPEPLIGFLKAVQQNSPVNAHVTPEPALMPGYEDQVVMAGGTFVEGSTIEFSADGPLRPPYVAFVQGGLSYLHVKCAIAGALEALAVGV
jgi:cystathionine beta-lyase family protein involved in aluminum resistance